MVKSTKKGEKMLKKIVFCEFLTQKGLKFIPQP